MSNIYCSATLVRYYKAILVWDKYMVTIDPPSIHKYILTIHPSIGVFSKNLEKEAFFSEVQEPFQTIFLKLLSFVKNFV